MNKQSLFIVNLACDLPIHHYIYSAGYCFPCLLDVFCFIWFFNCHFFEEGFINVSTPPEFCSVSAAATLMACASIITINNEH